MVVNKAFVAAILAVTALSFVTGAFIGGRLAAKNVAWRDCRTNEEVVAEMVNGARGAEDVVAIGAGMVGDWVRIVYRVRYVGKECAVLIGNGRVVMCPPSAEEQPTGKGESE